MAQILPKPLPDIVRTISEATILFEPNPLGILKGSLIFPNAKEARLKLTLGLDADRAPEYHLGLDRVPRIAPARFGIPAAGKGEWKSDNTFLAEIDEIGNINQFKITFVFEGQQVRGKIVESTGLGTISFRGKLQKKLFPSPPTQ